MADALTYRDGHGLGKAEGTAYLVIESVKLDAKHQRLSIARTLVDGALRTSSLAGCTSSFRHCDWRAAARNAGARVRAGS